MTGQRPLLVVPVFTVERRVCTWPSHVDAGHLRSLTAADVIRTQLTRPIAGARLTAGARRRDAWVRCRAHVRRPFWNAVCLLAIAS